MPDLENIFLETGALKKGHFKLSSGRHAQRYFQCAQVLSNPKIAQDLGEQIAALIPKSEAPDIVIAPAMGGLIIGHETARALQVRSIFTERVDGRMTLRRGFTLSPGQRCLIVEDVITTGKSTSEVAEVLRGLGAEISGVACIVLRAATSPDFNAPLHPLAHWPAESWDEKDCPACAADEPVIKPGSRDFKREEAC
jgi:orotate phosphoribosyltransferase